MLARKKTTAVLLALAAVTYVMGQALPFVWVKVGFGNPLVDLILFRLLLGRNLDAESLTLMGGIIKVYRGGQPEIAVVLFVFSVVFPAAKILVCSCCLFLTEIPGRLVIWLHWLGPWSMLDIFLRQSY